MWARERQLKKCKQGAKHRKRPTASKDQEAQGVGGHGEVLGSREEAVTSQG